MGKTMSKSKRLNTSLPNDDFKQLEEIKDHYKSGYSYAVRKCINKTYSDLKKEKDDAK